MENESQIVDTGEQPSGQATLDALTTSKGGPKVNEEPGKAIPGPVPAGKIACPSCHKNFEKWLPGYKCPHCKKPGPRTAKEKHGRKGAPAGRVLEGEVIHDAKQPKDAGEKPKEKLPPTAAELDRYRVCGTRFGELVCVTLRLCGKKWTPENQVEPGGTQTERQEIIDSWVSVAVQYRWDFFTGLLQVLVVMLNFVLKRIESFNAFMARWRNKKNVPASNSAADTQGRLGN